MLSLPIEPAEVDFGDPLAPSAPRFGDVYHARQGAFAQARHVFLEGSGLPGRWRGRAAFTILETGFGLGNNFLATWQAWRDSADGGRLRFISIEKHPLRPADLARAHATSPVPSLAQALVDAWPPLTPGLHVLAFDGGRVELLLYFGDVAQGLREIVANVDAFYLDGFAPQRNREMWDERVWRALPRLAAPGATAATWSAAAAVREGLASAGFEVHKAAGTGGKRDITLARHAPRAATRRPAFRVGTPSTRDVAVIGAGIAGAMAARALAREGVRVHVFEAAEAPAAGASGNPAALVHATFHPDDGPHARALRAAALMARDVYTEAIEASVAGRFEGMLRVVEEAGGGTVAASSSWPSSAPSSAHPPSTSRSDPTSASPLPRDADAALARAIADSGLPPDFVQAWDARRVQASGGPALPAACYPAGGWLAPAEAVGWALREPGIALHAATRVHALRAGTGEGAPRWHLLDESGRSLHETDCVVVAGGIETASLLSTCIDATSPVDGRLFDGLVSTRGQLSMLAAQTPGLRRPALPIAGGGYVIPLPDGRAVFGATTQPGDRDPALRVADHAHNLAQLAALTLDEVNPDAEALVASGHLSGRVGWRATTPDRLPWIGAVPCALPEPSPSPDQPRRWPRVPGLFVASGLGSRGVTWAPLAARLLVSWILDVPWPVESSLVDALDPARLGARAVRRERSRTSTPR